jgi:ribose-phosphate pyrophosphokinase
MKIFSGTANRDLAEKVCSHLDKKLSDINISKFSDGEIKLVINENVRKKECYIIQPTGPSENSSPNDNYIELFILIDALKRGSASSVTVVMPYYGYERQDRKDYSRAPISARVMATCLESLGVDRVITFDLHAGQIQGFFSSNTPLDNLYLESYFLKYIRKKIIKNMDNLDDLVMVAPDEGGMKRAVRMANKLCVSTATIYKERNIPNQISRMVLMGDVKGKICIIVDDIIDTAGTACKAAEVLKENGALGIYMFVSHGILSGPAIERITNSNFDKVIISNTLDQTYKELGEKIEVIDISWMCSEAMKRSVFGESLKELYDKNIDDDDNDTR